MIILREDGDIVNLDHVDKVFSLGLSICGALANSEDQDYSLGKADDEAHAKQIIIEIYKDYRAGSKGETFEELANRARAALSEAKDEQKDIYAPLLEDAQAGDEGPTK